ncbi:helix-turn-helix domain-containing protein [Streptomyces sp. NPDC056943]|uniref:helix-turn-helix domain-containing protein n=1 Tax=Streptomyces sp. NPDC056943 TaxID=3345971 RepID=UPI003626569D
MSVDGGAAQRPKSEVGELVCAVDPDDDWGVAVIETVGRQLRLRREAVGMRAADLGEATGYGEDMIYKIESGKRIPRPEFLDKADKVLRADGLVAAMKEDVAKVRYPKKARALAKLEAQAVEMQIYEPLYIPGLLQTPEHARRLFLTRRPVYTPEEVDRYTAARAARKTVFERSPAPELSFVLEEWTLRRPLGGREVLRRQLEHLLEVAELRHVQIQMMLIEQADHVCLSDGIEVLKFEDGSTVGRSPTVAGGKSVSDPRQLRILELRYGLLRAQALTPSETVDAIHGLLGET